MVDGIELTSLIPISFPAGFLLNVAFNCYDQAQFFSCWWIQGIFFEDFYSHVDALESTSVLSVWLQLKKIKVNIIAVILPYT